MNIFLYNFAHFKLGDLIVQISKLKYNNYSSDFIFANSVKNRFDVLSTNKPFA